MLNEVPCKGHGRLACLLCWSGDDRYGSLERRDVPGGGDRRPGTLGIPTGSQHHNHVYGNSVYRGPVGSRPRHQHHNDDTAPFDVEAFLAVLHGGGTDAAANHYGGDEDYRPAHNDQYEATIIKHNEYHNIRTHYYGDDCPGGHYDSEHPGPDNDDDTNYYGDPLDYCDDCGGHCR